MSIQEIARNIESRLTSNQRFAEALLANPEQALQDAGLAWHLDRIGSTDVPQADGTPDRVRGRVRTFRWRCERASKTYSCGF